MCDFIKILRHDRFIPLDILFCSDSVQILLNDCHKNIFTETEFNA